MAERHDFVHDIKDNGMLKHSVIVQLAHVFNLGDSALVVSEIVLLKAKADGFNYRVNDPDDEVCMVSV